MSRLRALQARQPLIKEVRGQGLLIGVELRNPKVNPLAKGGSSEKGFLTDVAKYLFSGLVVRHLLKSFRIFTAITAHDSNVLRIEPPLNTSLADLDYFLEAIESTLNHVSNFTGATLQALPDIAKYFLNGKLTAAID